VVSKVLIKLNLLLLQNQHLNLLQNQHLNLLQNLNPHHRNLEVVAVDLNLVVQKNVI
jgi:hypothetical protein